MVEQQLPPEVAGYVSENCKLFEVEWAGNRIRHLRILVNFALET